MFASPSKSFGVGSSSKVVASAISNCLTDFNPVITHFGAPSPPNRRLSPQGSPNVNRPTCDDLCPHHTAYDDTFLYRTTECCAVPHAVSYKCAPACAPLERSRGIEGSGADWKIVIFPSPRLGKPWCERERERHQHVECSRIL